MHNSSSKIDIDSQKQTFTALVLWHQDNIGNKIIPFKFFVLFNKENIFGDSNNTFTYKVQKSMVYGMAMTRIV